VSVSGADAFTAASERLRQLALEWAQALARGPGETAFLMPGTDRLRALVAAGTDEEAAGQALAEGFSLETLEILALLRNPMIATKERDARAALEVFDQIEQIDVVLRRYASLTDAAMSGPGSMAQTPDFPFPAVLALKGRIGAEAVRAATEEPVAAKRDALTMARKASWELLYVGSATEVTRGLGSLRGSGSPSAAKGDKYTCGMHPWIIVDKPGDCPVCFMKLTKIVAQPEGDRPAARGSSKKDEAEDFFADVAPKKAGGERGFDETRVRRVQTKVEGWVERLHVNFTGQQVAAGQPLVSIYSPELLATQEEYLRSRKSADRFTTSADPEVRGIGEELSRSARRRLELLDVPPSFVAELEKTGTPRKAVTINAPFGGYVTAKEVFEGQKVEPGMELFTLADLSRVWIEAALYEYEAAAAVVGKEATLTLAQQPGVVLRGKVTFVSPVLSAESRTLTVRFEFPNPGLVLKPQMYADVSLAIAVSQGVVVPDAALLDTGVRKVVFVETQPGAFEPREVTVGARGDGRAEILAGVREGELVAVKANFLLDSESRLRAAIERMTSKQEAAK